MCHLRHNCELRVNWWGVRVDTKEELVTGPIADIAPWPVRITVD